MINVQTTHTVKAVCCGVFMSILMLLAGCSMIDEDQGDCGEEARMDYELELITNISTEVKTELNTQADVSLASSLKEYLGDIFSDFAHDVNLLFYGVDDASSLLYHDAHIMNGSERTYTLTIPRQRYMHIAVANVEGDPVVRLEDTENCHKFIRFSTFADNLLTVFHSILKCSSIIRRAVAFCTVHFRCDY